MKNRKKNVGHWVFLPHSLFGSLVPFLNAEHVPRVGLNHITQFQAVLWVGILWGWLVGKLSFQIPGTVISICFLRQLRSNTPFLKGFYCLRVLEVTWAFLVGCEFQIILLYTLNVKIWWAWINCSSTQFLIWGSSDATHNPLPLPQWGQRKPPFKGIWDAARFKFHTGKWTGKTWLKAELKQRLGSYISIAQFTWATSWLLVWGWGETLPLSQKVLWKINSQ